MVVHCLKKGGEHAAPAHIQLLLDCAEICKLTATFMARDSEYVAQLSELCAEICDACADSCEEIASEGPMRKCIVTCRQAARSCVAMPVL